MRDGIDSMNTCPHDRHSNPRRNDRSTVTHVGHTGCTASSRPSSPILTSGYVNVGTPRQDHPHAHRPPTPRLRPPSPQHPRDGRGTHPGRAWCDTGTVLRAPRTRRVDGRASVRPRHRTPRVARFGTSYAPWDAPCLTVQCPRQESNLRPLVPETNALSPELRRRTCRGYHRVSDATAVARRSAR